MESGPETITAFSSFLPDLEFVETLSLLSTLLHLLQDSESLELITEVCSSVGTFLVEGSKSVFAHESVRECAGFFRALQRFVFDCPPIAAHDFLGAFYDALVNSILREFDRVLVMSSEEDKIFQKALCRFLRQALAQGWVRDMTLLVGWFEAMVGRHPMLPKHLKLAPFLPIAQMPLTIQFLQSIRPTDSLTFNVAICGVMGKFAEVGQFWDLFAVETLFQFMASVLKDKPRVAAILVERVVGTRPPPPMDFIRNLFQNLFLYALERDAGFQQIMKDAFAAIVRAAEDVDVLRAIVMEHGEASSDFAVILLQKVFQGQTEDH
jgi:hypothetical protein